MKVKVKGIVRYPHLMRPSAPKDSDKMKYGLQVLIHKSDAQCSKIIQAINEVSQNSFPNGIPQKFVYCYSDLAIDEPNNNILRDYIALNARTSAEFAKPQILDANYEEIIDPSFDNKSVGNIAYVVGEFKTYDSLTKGVNFYLNLVVDTGQLGQIPVENLSSKPSAEQLLNESIDMSTGNVSPTPISTIPAPLPPAPLPPAPLPPAPLPPAALPPAPLPPAALPPAPLPPAPLPPAPLPPAPLPPAPLPPAALPPAPLPPAPLPPAALPPAAPIHQMTAQANGATRESLHDLGWTDETLIQNGLMLPPNGVIPSFVQ